MRPSFGRIAVYLSAGAAFVSIFLDGRAADFLYGVTCGAVLFAMGVAVGHFEAAQEG